MIASAQSKSVPAPSLQSSFRLHTLAFYAIFMKGQFLKTTFNYILYYFIKRITQFKINDMKIALLHFSDIHFTQLDNIILRRLSSIENAIHNHLNSISHLFIVICGDIAFSGKNEEYKVAEEFLNSLKKKCESKSTEVFFVIAPGNHDCNFEFNPTNKQVRKITLESIRRNEAVVDDGIINVCCEIQNDFFGFASNFNSSPENLILNKLLNVYSFKINEKTIKFYSYNSAWTSELKENVGNLFFPIDMIPEEFYSTYSDLAISVIHHPFYWQSPQMSRNLINKLQSTSDLIITGHEHDFSGYLNSNFNGTFNEFIESGSLQDSKLDQSSFNLILYDFNKKSHQIITFNWSEDLYISEESEWIEFKSLFKEKNDFTVSIDFNKFLIDPGATFSHPQKIDLVLNDIFIFPDFKDLDISRKKKEYLDKIVSSKEVLDFTKGLKLIVTGNERSGKTTFCKILFRKAYEEKYIPIYINGTKIKSTNDKDIEKLIIKCFSEQYECKNLEYFKQTKNEKKIIIIDDFDKTTLKSRYRSNFLNNISKEYKNIFITGNDLFYLIEYLSDSGSDEFDKFDEFNNYQILQFGPSKRDKLIKKWYNVNVEETEYNRTLVQKLDHATKIINTVIGKNIVPAYPIFLLTTLQAIEFGKPQDLSISQYGYYYELLINLAIHKVVKKQELFVLYDNFLTEYCFYLFKKQLKELSEQEFQEFFEYFKEEYDISENKGLIELRSNLTEASIFCVRNEMICIPYKYIYYYYLAKYFRDNIQRDNIIKDTISKMCKRLYQEDCANTIMFLTHLSNDPFILKELLISSQEIFKEFNPIEMGKDIEPINNLISEIPKLILKSKNIEDSRNKKLEKEDKLEFLEKYESEDSDNSERTIDLDEDINTIDIVAKINLAIKTLEILGQIVRKYYARIKSDEKYELASETFLLGLRTLGFFITMISENIEGFIKYLIEFLSSHEKSLSNFELEKMVRRFLFQLSLLGSHGMIKRISSAIGSEDLIKTFNRIENQVDFNSVKLINVSIKLDFYKALPVNDLKKLKYKFENNRLAITVLKQLVIDHLYMFPTDRREKAKICGILDIRIQDQLIIDEKSKVRK